MNCTCLLFHALCLTYRFLNIPVSALCVVLAIAALAVEECNQAAKFHSSGRPTSLLAHFGAACDHMQCLYQHPKTFLCPLRTVLLKNSTRNYSLPLPKTSNHRKTATMPLVIPGVMSNNGGDDKNSQWMNKLMGKKIGDSSNETVSAVAIVVGFAVKLY